MRETTKDGHFSYSFYLKIFVRRHLFEYLNTAAGRGCFVFGHDGQKGFIRWNTLEGMRVRKGGGFYAYACANSLGERSFKKGQA